MSEPSIALIDEGGCRTRCPWLKFDLDRWRASHRNRASSGRLPGAACSNVRERSLHRGADRCIDGGLRSRGKHMFMCTLSTGSVFLLFMRGEP